LIAKIILKRAFQLLEPKYHNPLHQRKLLSIPNMKNAYD
jgi:hypothetical protein